MKLCFKILGLITLACGLYALYYFHPWDTYNFRYDGKDYLCDEIAFDKQDNVLYVIRPDFQNGDTIPPITGVSANGDSLSYWWMPKKKKNKDDGSIYAPSGRLLVEPNPVSPITHTYYNYYDKRSSNYIEYTDIHVVVLRAGEVELYSDYDEYIYGSEPFVGSYEDRGWFRLFKTQLEDKTIVKICYLDNDRQPKYDNSTINRQFDGEKYETTTPGTYSGITELYLYKASSRMH